MDNTKKIKKIHQFFFGYVQNSENDLEQRKNIYKTMSNLINDESRDHIVEKYPKDLIREDNRLFVVLKELDERVFGESRSTQIQLLVNRKITGFGRGSYCVLFPYAYETGCYEDEMSTFFEKDESAMIIVCSDIQYINCMGRDGYASALKQAGEIRQIVKRELGGEYIVKEKINYNSLAHAAGLNVNSMMILDAIGLKCK